MKNLSDRIRIIRLTKGYSQEYVASLMGLSQSAYSQIERKAGDCKLNTLLKVASALGVEISYLIDLNNSLISGS